VQLLLTFLFLFSFQANGQDLKLPPLSSPVMDLANLISDKQEQELASIAYEIHTNNGPQITILTVPDLQNYEIEDFSIRLAEQWKLGSKEKDNGLIVVISKAERKVRIEVGGGIEGEITDYYTAQYTRSLFPKYFKKGEFGTGLLVFMADVAKKFNIPLKNTATNRFVRRAPNTTKSGPGKIIIIIIFGILAFGSIIFSGKPLARGIFTALGFSGVGLFMGAALTFMIFIFILGLVLGLVGVGNFLTALALGAGRGGHYGGRGGGGGGGWSGGGGGFSGGGSSGSW
jgi:uncharacterized protein